VTSPADAFCLALDVPDASLAEQWVRRAHERIGTFKIGLQLFCAEGPDVVARMRAAGARRVFLDLKLHDIPNTVGSAVRALSRIGVDLLTIHTSGGMEMMRAAVAEAGATRLLGVTVLTSLDTASLAEIGEVAGTDHHIEKRAEAAVRAGLAGLVCSAAEVATVRRIVGPDVALVTPGIRLSDAAGDDQKRVATPGRARRNGATLLVVGRPVLAAGDWEAALTRLQDDWRGGDDGHRAQ
jgi:orotidine-5'-phosphate decarboxylase